MQILLMHHQDFSVALHQYWQPENLLSSAPLFCYRNRFWHRKPSSWGLAWAFFGRSGASKRFCACIIGSFVDSLFSVLCCLIVRRLTDSFQAYVIMKLWLSKINTVFENHRKSLIQYCKRSELCLHFEWTKVNQKWQKMSILASFWES